MNALLAFSPSFLQRLIWIPTRLLFRVFLRWRIEGLKNLEGLPRGILLSVNHTSELDPVLSAAAFPFWSKHLPLFYVSRSPSHYTHLGWRSKLYGGFLFKLWGSYAAESGTHDYEKSLAPHIKLLKKGKTVCIFPFGKILRPGETPRIHGGIAYLSWKTNAPILPLTISGAEGLTLPKLLKGTYRVIVRFGETKYPLDLFSEFGNEPIISSAKNDFRTVAEHLVASDT